MLKKKSLFYFPVLIFILITGCQKSLDSNVNDATLPRVTDLKVDSLKNGTAYLSWTAPNYDPAYGGLYRYDLRYSSESIDILDWEPANLAEAVPEWISPRKKEHWKITGLDNDTDYFFGIKFFNDQGEISEVSNIAPIRDFLLHLDDNILLNFYWQIGLDSGDIRYSDVLRMDTLWIFPVYEDSDPEGLQHFLNLRCLHALEPRLTSYEFLTPLKNMEYLYLSDRLVDTVSCSYLQNMHNLKSLSINFPILSEPEYLERLTGLIELSMVNCRFEDAEHLYAMTDLRKLDLRYNNISNISVMGDLSSLEELDLSSNQISNAQPVMSCVSLRSLGLSSNNIAHFEVTNPMSQLEYLVLAGNELTVFEAGDNLPSLATLSLGGNNLQSLSGLSEITSLTFLRIDDNIFNALNGISSLRNLETLAANGNAINNLVGIEGCKNLEVLYLQENMISDISSLHTLINLNNINLSRNEISDITSLQNLKKLEILFLRENNIVDIEPLAKLENLSQLYLGRNNITDISALVENPGLGKGDRVDLSYNPLSEKAIDEDIPSLRARGVEVAYWTHTASMSK